MSSRRNQLAIITQILEMPRINRLAVILDCELNPQQYQRYLSFLLRRGLLEEERGRADCYRLTGSGKELLRHLHKVQTLLNFENQERLTGSSAINNYRTYA